MKVGIAGSLESNDVLVTVRPSESLIIDIHSIVDLLFHDQIEKVVRDTLKEKNIDKLEVTIEDKGALDYTIRARLLTALRRMGDEK
ncbi:MAG: citrate lyase acyl carrier protein [Candidatus Izemoplasmatales bacterium]|jgi:citrate lyase subunit gamma (acyl carrier protein)|nr:citrate lyase acyl carrier protein [Candidatus Izemoplasmatales bacterium]MDD5294118.1 citrate lyase acyl carrier protein [Candidatus Izemoplasmatales bacterium]